MGLRLRSASEHSQVQRILPVSAIAAATASFAAAPIAAATVAIAAAALAAAALAARVRQQRDVCVRVHGERSDRRQQPRGARRRERERLQGGVLRA